MRPLIIGLNNPCHGRADFALWPDPPASIGNLLWKLLSNRTGASRQDYVDVFDRITLLGRRIWSAEAAKREAEGLWETLEGRTVLLLGAGVRAALSLPRVPLLSWQTTNGVRWCEIPHPSVVGRVFEDPTVNSAVEMRLEELYIRNGFYSAQLSGIIVSQEGEITYENSKKG